MTTTMMMYAKQLNVSSKGLSTVYTNALPTVRRATRSDAATKTRNNTRMHKSRYNQMVMCKKTDSQCWHLQTRKRRSISREDLKSLEITFGANILYALALNSRYYQLYTAMFNFKWNNETFYYSQRYNIW